MKWFRCFINGSEIGAVLATNYRAALNEARRTYGRRCDCIG